MGASSPASVPGGRRTSTAPRGSTSPPRLSDCNASTSLRDREAPLGGAPGDLRGPSLHARRGRRLPEAAAGVDPAALGRQGREADAARGCQARGRVEPVADPETYWHKAAVLERHCTDVDRDPSEIRRSAQVLLYSEDESGVPDGVRALKRFLPSMGGSVEEFRDVVDAYAEAGLDELSYPISPTRPEPQARGVRPLLLGGRRRVQGRVSERVDGEQANTGGGSASPCKLSMLFLS